MQLAEGWVVRFRPIQSRQVINRIYRFGRDFREDPPACFDIGCDTHRRAVVEPARDSDIWVGRSALDLSDQPSLPRRVRVAAGRNLWPEA